MAYNEEKKCGTFLKLKEDILTKFLHDNSLEIGERVIFTRKINGLDLFGENESYYKVYTLNETGILRSYISENTTSNVWYRSLI